MSSLEEVPKQTQNTLERSLGWPGHALQIPQINWRRWLEIARSGHHCLGCCPCNPALKKQKKMYCLMENIRALNGRHTYSQFSI